MARRRWSFWMSPLEHRSIRWLDDHYRGLLTVPGRVLLWSAVAAGTMLSGGLALALVWIFAFCVGALVAAVLSGLFFRPKLSFTRQLPPPASAGEELRYRVRVENTGRGIARHVAVEERDLPADLRPIGEPPVIAELAPGASIEVELKLACLSRGAYHLSRMQGGTAFPSGLVKWARPQKLRDQVLVYPKLAAIESFDVPVGRNYQPGGIAVASSLGDSSEFFGTREWRHGDRVRDIHWPSFARTGRPIVKEFQEEYFVRLAMVIDVEARTAKDETRFERSLELAASIADSLARRDYIIDLFAAGTDVFHFQAGRALAHVENILEILAALEPGDRIDVDALSAALVPEAEKLSAVVFVMNDWEPKRAALVEELKKRGVAVRVLAMHPKHRPTGLSPDEVVELA